MALATSVSNSQNRPLDAGVVYSSGVLIRDEDYLATLTVLYSRVYLPNTDNPILSSFADASDGPVERDEQFVQKAVHAARLS